MAGKSDPTGGLSSGDAARLAERVAGLTGANLPLAPGLRAAAEELPIGRLRSALTEVASALDSGAPIEDVLGGNGGPLPGHFRGVITAGARTGRISEALGRFVAFLSVGIELRRKLWVSLAYPVLALVLALAIFSFICATIVSSFENIFKDFGVPLPWATMLLLRVAAVFARGWRPIVELAVGLIGLTVVMRLVLSSAQRRSLLAGVPVLGQVWRNTSLAEFCHLLALLIECDVPLPESIKLTGEGVEDGALQRACHTMNRDVEAGLTLAQAVARQPVFPRGLSGMLRWAEGHESLSGSLEMAGQMFEARARSQASFAGTVLGALTLISIVAGVIWVIVGLFIPLMTLLARLSG